MLYLVDAEVGKDIFSVCEQPHVQFAELHILQFEAEKNLLTPNHTTDNTSIGATAQIRYAANSRHDSQIPQRTQADRQDSTATGVLYYADQMVPHSCGLWCTLVYPSPRQIRTSTCQSLS